MDNCFSIDLVSVGEGCTSIEEMFMQILGDSGDKDS